MSRTHANVSPVWKVSLVAATARISDYSPCDTLWSGGEALLFRFLSKQRELGMHALLACVPKNHRTAAPATGAAHRAQSPPG